MLFRTFASMKHTLLYISLVFSMAPALRAEEPFEYDQDYRPVTIEVPSQGPRSEIIKTPFNPDSLYTDTIGFGSGECNWGGPVKIGLHGKQQIRAGYDYNYLTHVVYSGNRIIAQHPALLITDISKRNNSAMFSIGKNKVKLLFSDPQFETKLKNFVEPKKGLTRESYTFAYSNRNYFSTRFTVTADLPDDKAKQAAMVKYMNDHYSTPTNTGDTVLIVNRPVNSLLDMVELANEICIINTPNYTEYKPDATIAPMSGTVTVDYWQPVSNSGKYMTLYLRSNMTYPAGGCRSSEELYTTINSTTGKAVTSADIFNNPSSPALLNIFFNAVSKELIASELPYATTQEQRKALTEGYSPKNIRSLFTEYEEPSIPEKAAMIPQGVIISYDGGIITDFGETGYYNVTIPWVKVQPYLKKDIAAWARSNGYLK